MVLPNTKKAQDGPSPRISATAGFPVSGFPSIRRLSRLEILLTFATLVLLQLNLSDVQTLPTQQTNNKNPELLSDANGSTAPMFLGQQQLCLSFDPNQGNTSQDMDSLVASASQIFVTMPAKAGGTSMKQFTKRCMKNNVADNILSLDQLWKKYLVNSPRIQPIISSHLYRAIDLSRLAKLSSRKTLIIHTHREESSRVISAVNQIANSVCNFLGARYSNEKQTRTTFKIQKNNSHCILDEGSFVNEIAANGAEVGFSTHRLLTCQSYEAIQDNSPQLVFLHYKQVDKLQRLLAKHHCPEMLDDLPIKANVAASKPLQVMLHKNGTNTDRSKSAVRLEDWLDEKGPAMEWALKLRRDASCQAKTVHMEDELFACPDETLRVTSESIDRW